MKIQYIDQEFIQENTDFLALVKALRQGFMANTYDIRPRIHQDYDHRTGSDQSTLLMMPAWNKDEYAGVKVVTVNPHNHRYSIPSIQGTYILMDSDTGVVLAILDAKALTTRRTAAASALASSILSREDSSTMLMIGNGALAPQLIQAHITVRPIEKVYLWGRNYEKSLSLIRELTHLPVEIHAIETISDQISNVDIVSCATLSPTPLVLGKYIRKGQHIDLVGSYKPTTREADDELLLKSRIFVDVMESGVRESGDIFIPLDQGIITRSDIGADLFQLCNNTSLGRKNSSDITTFKSVGHALEDLIGAGYYYKKFIE